MEKKGLYQIGDVVTFEVVHNYESVNYKAELTGEIWAKTETRIGYAYKVHVQQVISQRVYKVQEEAILFRVPSGEESEEKLKRYIVEGRALANKLGCNVTLPNPACDGFVTLMPEVWLGDFNKE